MYNKKPLQTINYHTQKKVISPMNAHLKIICLFILMILSLPGFAQNSNLKFKALSLDEGLSQSTVYAILQDSLGFLWVGTQDGLNKYDGYEFTVYRHDPQDLYSLSHNEIFTLHEDSSGTLWIGTGGGLNRFDREQDQFIRYQSDMGKPNHLSNNTVWSIHEDNSGLLWIGTNGGGLNQFDPQQETFVHYQHDPKNPQSLSDDAVWPIYQDKTGILWIGTDGGGLNRFDPQQQVFTHYLPNAQVPDDFSNYITSIYEDKTGILWIGTINGLHKFDRFVGSFVSYFPDPQNPNSLSYRAVWAICEDSLGRLWVGTDGGGLNQFDRESETFVHYQHDPQNATSLNNDVIFSLYPDRAGTIWVGTGGGGLNQFNPRLKKFEHYYHEPKNPNSLNYNDILSIYEDREGILWVGTEGGGLNQFDQKRQTVTHYLPDPENPNSLSHDEVQSIYEDKKRVLWIGTYGGGLNRFNREQNQFVSYQNDPNDSHSLGNDYVMSIYEDKTGILWIGTREGLDQFDRDSNQFVHYTHNPNEANSLSDNAISAIYEDSSGMLWIGTEGEGVNKFDRESNQFVHYQHAPQNLSSLSHNDISAIHEDKNGGLWIGTFGGGLNKFDRATETFTHYRKKQGLANDTVYGILEDNQGNLWLSTNKGLSKFNLKTEQFRHYDVADGLQSNEFNTAHHKSRRGELFFGGINGFNAFYPEQVKDNPYRPPLVMTDFKIFNQSVPIDAHSPLQQHINLTKEITLSYKQSFFVFEFAALNFVQPEKNQYAYQLEGFDHDWNQVGTLRHAHYTNVPHGEYTFRVKGSNNDNVWNEQGATIKIIIPPPPWKTWWAYTLYVLTILAIIVSYIRAQQRKLLAKQQELEHEQQELEREQKISAQLREADRLKDEFLANTSHELRTPLNGIIGIAESLVDGAAGPINQQLRSNLDMIVGSGRRLFSLVNDILDFSHLKQKEINLQIKAVDIRSIADVVLALTQPLIGSKKIELSNTIPSDLPPINADENRVQQILYNLVGNAIKFTDRGEVKISAETVTMAKTNLESVHNETKGDDVSALALEKGLAITVSDTGIGVLPEKLDRIFEAFEQADGGTARIYGGTGLGLAVTQKLVQLHGGKMSVQSQPGVGSEFTFILPSQLSVISKQLSEPVQISQASQYTLPLDTKPLLATTSQESHLQITEENTGLQPTEENRQFTILVVDDDQINRQVLVNHLSLHNYTIHEAASGMETLAYFEKKNKPDLILLDIMMPQMNGYDVTRKIRETWKADKLPIILLTAKDQIADLVLGLESGANDYLTKPVYKEELIARIKTHVHILQLQAKALQVAIENRNKLKQILEGIPIGVAMLNCKGEPSYINKRAKQLLGKSIVPNITPEQIPAVYQLYHADTNELYPSEELPIVQALQGKKLTTDDIEIHHHDCIIPVETWGTPIFDKEGKIIYAISAFLDITERKKAERLQKEYNQTLKREVAEKTQALRENETQLRQAKDAANAANRAKSTFLANMSHELRTPLNAILGFTQIMQRGQSLPPQDQKHLNIIHRSGEYLLSLINDVLDMSKIEAGKITLDEQEFDLHHLLDEVHHLFYLKAQDKHLQWLVKLEENVPHYIRTDSKKLRQILINLLSNALKFTQTGSVYLYVEAISPPKEETDADEKTTLDFKIEDTGAGVAEEELNKLFEPFSQTASGRVAQEGTGLGLPISRQFIQLMGGEISVESQIGKGTVFQFTIHASIVKTLKNANTQTHQVIALESNQPRYRILIVDDKVDNRQLLIQLLNPLGFELREADNGEEAINIFENWQPHLIWMDIQMPIMDGYQATQHIKAKNAQSQKVVIIALSASTFENENEKALSAGCDDFLRKPFREASIFDLMKKHLGVRYVYEKTDNLPETKKTNQAVLTPSALAALPSELLSELEKATTLCDMEMINFIIEQIHSHNADLADALETLANDFKYDEISALLVSEK